MNAETRPQPLLAATGVSCRDAVFWSSALVVATFLVVTVIGPQRGRHPGISPERYVLGAILCLAVAFAHGAVVRETLAPWLGRRPPFGWSVVGAVTLDGMWLVAVVMAAATQTAGWSWFFAMVTASIVLTAMTLRMWLQLGSAAALLAAVPLLMSALMALTAGGVVCGQMASGIRP